MSRIAVFILILFKIFLISVKAKHGYGPGEQDWGYIDVRKGAHMFYWLYYTNATANPTDRPLAIWLQGGPGGSSTGKGNFEELGPLDLNGNYRNFTWVKHMNVLFIDNPVGTGFSYVDNDEYYAKNNTEIARDLVSFMKRFYKKHPKFEKVPLHIFSQSYGGKMATEFALKLYYAVQRGELKSNLKSVGLGSPWTSPIESVLAWAPLLFYTGIIDIDGYNKVVKATNKIAELTEAERWTEATMQWNIAQDVVANVSHNVNFYNILKTTEDNDKQMERLMQGPVSKALSIPRKVKWGSKDILFDKYYGDFMKPVIHIVEELLNKTDLQVFVYSGQLDLMCASAGTVSWINKMRWSYGSKYDAARRSGIIVDHILEGYEKGVGNFTMFWINRAGHSIPADNPKGMDYILRKITKYDKNLKH